MGCTKDDPAPSQKEEQIPDFAPDKMPDCTISTSLYDNKSYIFKGNEVTIKWDGDYSTPFTYEKKLPTEAIIEYSRSEGGKYWYNGSITITLTFEKEKEGTCIYEEIYTSNLIGSGTDVEEGTFIIN